MLSAVIAGRGSPASQASKNMARPTKHHAAVKEVHAQ